MTDRTSPHSPLPPAEMIVVMDGHAAMPDAFVPDAFALEPVTLGLGIAWVPVAPSGPALILLQGGNPDTPSMQRLVVQMSLEGIEGLAHDLLSIVAQLQPAQRAPS